MKKFLYLSVLSIGLVSLFMVFKQNQDHKINIDSLGLEIDRSAVDQNLITVLITRHAEKTHNPRPVSFEKWNLEKTHPLNARGWERAGGLASRLILESDISKYGEIVAVYAPTPDKIYNSVRPIQTATPTADFLKLEINTKYNLDESEKIAQEILTNSNYLGKVVYIAWEHHHIPTLAREGFKCMQAPDTWDEEVFDVIWVMQFEKDGKIKDFKEVPQSLLYGDSKTATALPSMA